MKKIQVARINEEGIYLEPVIVNEDEKLSKFLIKEDIPQGFYKPKWNFRSEEWLEGLTQEEVEEINKPEILPPSEIEILQEENEQLKQEIETLQEESNVNAMAIMELAEAIMPMTLKGGDE